MIPGKDGARNAGNHFNMNKTICEYFTQIICKSSQPMNYSTRHESSRAPSYKSQVSQYPTAGGSGA
jgi:hypothetical protein